MSKLKQKLGKALKDTLGGYPLQKPNKKTLKRLIKKEPVWKGPEVDGITQSLLSRFLVCRERFRILVVEGLKPADQFNHRIEYGNMWHLCKEHQVGGVWPQFLLEYIRKLCKKYPLQIEQINHWLQVCQIQFPIYLDYWKKNGSKQKRTSLLQEQSFEVPYTLPSGRVVLLRGKWDGVDLLGSGKKAGIWLVEHKTKGDVKEEQINQQLQFDLQTMLYLVALQHTQVLCKGNRIPDWLDADNRFSHSIKGVLYNVVRRPLSGGKGSIRQHKATKNKPEETQEHFYGRVSDIIKEDPSNFFIRWQVTVTQQDTERFKREFLNPVLEQLCDWWEWVTDCPDPFHYVRHYSEGVEGLTKPNEAVDCPPHWRTPYGFYNVLAEGGSTELDEYLVSGSTAGLERTENLFPELEEQSGQG